MMKELTCKLKGYSLEMKWETTVDINAEMHGNRLFQRVAFEPNIVLRTLSRAQIQDGVRCGRYAVEVAAILD